MEITGKIIAVLEPRRGTSSRTGSEWICGQYVLETMDQYPRKLFFEVFGSDRMQQFNIQLGEIMTVPSILMPVSIRVVGSMVYVPSVLIVTFRQLLLPLLP